MSKVYFVRHQAAGIVARFPFAQHPTEEQVAAVAKDCFVEHGASHAKTPDKPYWTMVVDFDLLGDEVPVARKHSLGAVSASGVGVAATGEIGVSGTGHVTSGGETMTLTAEDVGHLEIV